MNKEPQTSANTGDSAVTPAPARTYGLLAAGLLMFAFAPIVVRLAGSDADPVAITTIRTVAAFLALLPFWVFRRVKRSRELSDIRKKNPDFVNNLHPSWSRREVGWSALAGFFLAAHFMLWIGSLFYTSVASASVLVTIHPVMLIVVESLFLKKRFPVLSWIGVLIALSGSVLLGISDHAPGDHYSNPFLGNLMALSAAFLFVMYILISQKIRKNSSWLDYVFTVYGFTALASVLIAFALSVNWLIQPLPTILSGLGLAIGAQLIGHGSLNYAVKFITATLLSTLILCEPVFATILAAIFFDEIPTVIAAFSMGIIMSGTLMTWWGRRGKKAGEN